MEFETIQEKFGMYFSEVGLSKTYGRLFGYFMLSKHPLSMGDLVSKLKISKSTASVEIRRLLTMGVIEKVLLSNERTDFYQLKENIWELNLNQKIHDIKKLREIVEGIPFNEKIEGVRELVEYCIFMESELKLLTKKYKNFQEEKVKMKTETTGVFKDKTQNFPSLIIEWSKLHALSDEFADKMTTLAELGIKSFRDVEIEFLSAYPHLIQEDKSLINFIGLDDVELKEKMDTKLHQIFYSRPENLNEGIRSLLANAYYHFITIKDELSDKTLGFILFLSGGPIPENELKITVLVVDKEARGNGLAGILINSLKKMNVRAKKIIVCTRPSNVVAINVYKKLGFVEDSEAEKNAPPYLIKGHWVHLARFE